jgi:hypothetical protein
MISAAAGTKLPAPDRLSGEHGLPERIAYSHGAVPLPMREVLCPQDFATQRLSAVEHRGVPPRDPVAPVQSRRR